MKRTFANLDGPPKPDEERWAAERRRILWWTVAVGVLLVIGLFGRLRWNNPTIQTADGQTFEVLARGREVGLHATATVLRYRSNVSEVDSVEVEMLRVLPFAVKLAQANGDSIIILEARRTIWQYGLASVGHTHRLRLVRRGQSRGWGAV